MCICERVLLQSVKIIESTYIYFRELRIREATNSRILANIEFSLTFQNLQCIHYTFQ